MAEYNKSICRSCFHSYVCQQFNEHRDSYNEKCHFFNDHYVPATDVIPVVRCEDCKHQEDCMKQLVFWERDHVLEQNVYQYHKLDFCSYGERRTDNG